MKFARTVTKREKKAANQKKTVIIIFLITLLIVNVLLVYFAFFQKPRPILSPLSKNQISSNQILEDKLKKSGIEYSALTTGKDLSYLIKLESGAEIVIDQDKDFEEQLSSLQLILKQLKIGGKVLKRLDFRYQKPIITF